MTDHRAANTPNRNVRSAARKCPHTAAQIDERNPCSCGIWWTYDYGVEAWRPQRWA